MRRFNSAVIKMKDGGQYVPLPALRAQNSYEVAQQNGFEGTEEEWVEMLLGDGWIGVTQNLEKTKANKEDVYTKEQIDATEKELREYQTPWNVDANVGMITVHKAKFSEPVSPTESVNKVFPPIYMINSGTIYINFIIDSYDLADNTLRVSLYRNETLLKTYTTDGDYRELLDVTKGDEVKFMIEGTHNDWSSAMGHIHIYEVAIEANIDTPHQYIRLIPSHTDDDATISPLDVLLGGAE